MNKVYIIGSLRNPDVPKLGNYLRADGWEVFDDWFAAGPEADDKWMQYEQGRGHTFAEALKGKAADHVFNFDRKHLDLADIVVLMLPAGKSGHLEFGYCIGRGKPGFILLPGEPERFDVMYAFATGVHTSWDALAEAMLQEREDQLA